MGLDILGISTVVETVGNVVDKFVTTDEERQKLRNELELALKQMETDLNKGQMEINKAEAQHASVFVAGWRPFIGWVAGAGLAFTYLIHPLLVWGWTLLQGAGVVPADLPPPPPYDLSQLMGLLAAMLGFGAYRTFEKTKGVQRERL